MRSSKSEQRRVERARVILLAASGLNGKEIALKMKTRPAWVSRSSAAHTVPPPSRRTALQSGRDPSFSKGWRGSSFQSGRVVNLDAVFLGDEDFPEAHVAGVVNGDRSHFFTPGLTTLH
jgi:hypothetical protein